mmetsp:Transcript_3232/g.8305  ORF Transcript_3232/g.8305 Transcript_3232/m.8305 type:complete len:254 (+) Transcript_3232:462-1223(+)
MACSRANSSSSRTDLAVSGVAVTGGAGKGAASAPPTAANLRHVAPCSESGDGSGPKASPCEQAGPGRGLEEEAEDVPVPATAKGDALAALLVSTSVGSLTPAEISASTTSRSNSAIKSLTSAAAWAFRERWDLAPPWMATASSPPLGPTTAFGNNACSGAGDSGLDGFAAAVAPPDDDDNAGVGAADPPSSPRRRCRWLLRGAALGEEALRLRTAATPDPATRVVATGGCETEALSANGGAGLRLALTGQPPS